MVLLCWIAVSCSCNSSRNVCLVYLTRSNQAIFTTTRLTASHCRHDSVMAITADRKRALSIEGIRSCLPKVWKYLACIPGYLQFSVRIWVVPVGFFLLFVYFLHRRRNRLVGLSAMSKFRGNRRGLKGDLANVTYFASSAKLVGSTALIVTQLCRSIAGCWLQGLHQND